MANYPSELVSVPPIGGGQFANFPPYFVGHSQAHCGKFAPSGGLKMQIKTPLPVFRVKILSEYKT
ncbi:hypothetical protein HHE014_05680 [Helicobacter heilmannii]|nr:hypothetical protein HHE014_05680 [Helicobacter heilmannii]